MHVIVFMPTGGMFCDKTADIRDVKFYWQTYGHKHVYIVPNARKCVLHSV